MERLLFNRSGLRRLLALKGAGAGGTLTENTVTGNPATFSTNVARALSGFTVPFLPIQAGSGDPSPDNVRPISGITGLAIMQNSTNAIETLTFTDGYYLNDNGTPTATQAGFRHSDYLPVTPGTVMRYYALTNATGKVRVHEYDADKTWLRQVYSASPANGAYNEKFTVSADAVYIRFSAPTGSTNEFIGVDRSIDWTSEAGTVYGGELDVKTGVLTVNTKFLAFGDDAGWASVGTKFYATIDDTEFAYIVSDQLSNMELYGGISWQGSAGVTTDKHFYLQKGSESNPDWNRIWVYDSAYTLTTFKALLAVTPIQFTFPITPRTVQLDPVAVQSIIGSNSIWTDTNGTNTIKYLTRQ